MGKFALKAVMLGFVVAVSAPSLAQASQSAPPPASVESKGVATGAGATPDSKGVATGVGATPDNKGVATAVGATPDDKAVATLRIDGGVIMLSDGGPFVSAVANQPVITGERLMVAKDSVARVIYNDGCEQLYDKAGVYKIDASCKPVAALFSDPNPWKTAAIVATVIGGAAVGKLIDDHGCDCKCGDPVSH